MGRGGNDSTEGAVKLVPQPPTSARPPAEAGRSNVKERGYFTERVGPGRDHASDKKLSTTGRTAEPPLPEATGGPNSDSYTPRRQVQSTWSAKAPALPATLYEFDAGRYSIDAPAPAAVGPPGTPRRCTPARTGTPARHGRTAAQDRELRLSARGVAIPDIKLTRTDEPKLQIQYKTKPGDAPRSVQLEREK